MSDFYKVTDSFSLLINEHGFARAPAVWDKNYVVLVKKYKTQKIDFYCYVIIEENGSGGIQINVWVTVLSRADGTLYRLPTCLRIIIANQNAVDERYLFNCQQKIIHLLPLVRGLGSFLENELEYPTLYNRNRELNFEYNYYERLLVEDIRKSDSYEKIENLLIKALSKEQKSIKLVANQVRDYFQEHQERFPVDVSEYIQDESDAGLDLNLTIANLLYIDKAATLAAENSRQ